MSGSGIRTGLSSVKVLEFGTEGTLTSNSDFTVTGSANFTKISGSSTLEMVGAAYFGSTVAATGSITAGSSFIIGSADLDETDLEKLDGITNGTVAANKAVVVDGSKDLAGVNDLTLEGSLIIGDASMSEADLEKLDDISDGTVAASKAVVVDSNKDASGFRNVTATGAITAGTSFVIGSADLDETDLEKLDDITDGTAAASKALVLDSNKDASGLRNLSLTSITDGTATLTSGRFADLTDLTASYAKIGVLDVETINSKTTTVENVEVSASLMILSDGAALPSEADGSGMFISGANAQFVWNNSKAALSSSHKMFVGGNMELDSGASLVIGDADMNEADLEKLDGITNGSVAADKAVVVDSNKDAAGFRNVSGSGTISGFSGDYEGGVSALGGFAVGLTPVVSPAKQLQNIASLDATTEATVEAAIDTLANLVSAGTSGADLVVAGPLDLEEGLKQNGSEILSDAGALGGLTTISGSSTISGHAGDFETSVDALAGFAVGGTSVVSSARALQNIASLDATTESTIETAIDTLANLRSAGTSGTALVVAGPLDLEEGLKQNGSEILSDAGALGGLTTISGSSTISGHALDIETSAAMASVLVAGATISGAEASSGVVMKVPETMSIKAGQFVTFSDATLKKNVKQLDGAIDKVMSMRGVSYEMKSDANDRQEVGFIAQEMKQVVPEVVYGDGDGNHGIDYGKLTSILVEAVKAQQTQIDELKALLKK